MSREEVNVETIGDDITHSPRVIVSASSFTSAAASSATTSSTSTPLPQVSTVPDLGKTINHKRPHSPEPLLPQENQNHHNKTIKVIAKNDQEQEEAQIVEIESVDSEILSITEIDNDSNNVTIIQDTLPAARYTRTQHKTTPLEEEEEEEEEEDIASSSSTPLSSSPAPTTQIPRTRPARASASTTLIKIKRALKPQSRRFLPTGYVYDVYMSFHATPDPTEIHPEDPRRIFKIYNILAKNGILNECKRIESRKATRNEILLVHTPSHYQTIRDTAYLSKRSEYMALERKFNSIYLNANSFESALYASGCLIELVKAVYTDELMNAFAIIRPPGHHAEVDALMGFCLFNNVAIATRDCMARFGCKRVLILDWDVHFGNGTQNVFAEDPNVLYISLHRYDDGEFYPHDKKADADNVGVGEGVGKTVNIPWPCAGMTDADYVYAFRQVVMPIACEFEPELVIVSAGFDAAINDPIGLCKVTPAGYGQMTHQLKTLANGKLVVALEGGYDLNSIANSALACMQVLLGESPEVIDPQLLPQPACVDTIEKVKKVQSKYWNSCI